MEVVGILSASKQRRSLGGTKKREKGGGGGRKPGRNCVVAPGEVKWPDVGEEGVKEIVGEIERSMKCLQFPVRTCPLEEIKKVPKSDRRKARREWIRKNNLEKGYDVSKYTVKRSQLTIGINCCSLAMEKNELSGLMLEKNVDPEIITKLLVPIAKAKGVPVVALKGLREAVRKGCGINSIAVGFKKSCDSEASEFFTLLSLIKEHAPKAEVDPLLLRTEVIRTVADAAAQLMPSKNKNVVLRPHGTTIESTRTEGEVNEEMKEMKVSEGEAVNIKIAAGPSPPLPPAFSIDDEIKRLEEKKQQMKRSHEMPTTFIPHKVRKIMPKNK